MLTTLEKLLHSFFPHYSLRDNAVNIQFCKFKGDWYEHISIVGVMGINELQFILYHQ